MLRSALSGATGRPHLCRSERWANDVGLGGGALAGTSLFGTPTQVGCGWTGYTIN
jgi:hypothetical protein